MLTVVTSRLQLRPPDRRPGSGQHGRQPHLRPEASVHNCTPSASAGAASRPPRRGRGRSHRLLPVFHLMADHDDQGRTQLILTLEAK